MKLYITLLYLCLALPAHAERLLAIPSHTQISVTSSFNGASLVIFGAIERDENTLSRNSDYDVMAVVKGPNERITVWQKLQAGPIWINRKSRTFEAAPGYLAFLSNRPLSNFTTPVVRAQYALGLQELKLASKLQGSSQPGDLAFRNALVRLYQDQNLYAENPVAVQFFSPALFTAQVSLPANAPVGQYDVDIFLFAGDSLVGRSQHHFRLSKAGLEEWIYATAHETPLLYGIISVVMALCAGWLGYLLRRS